LQKWRVEEVDLPGGDDLGSPDVVVDRLGPRARLKTVVIGDEFISKIIDRPIEFV
jgi:hypothetical protein